MFLDTEPPQSISCSKSESETPIRQQESTKQRMRRLEGKYFVQNSTNVHKIKFQIESDIIDYSQFEEDGSRKGRLGNYQTQRKGQIISKTSPQTNPIKKILETK